MGRGAVGMVGAVGAGMTRLVPGDRVITETAVCRGDREPCLRGHGSFRADMTGTEAGIDYDGAFAHYIPLPERLRRLLPEDMSSDGARVEPPACAPHGLVAGGPRAGETEATVGGGPVGMVRALAARGFGARVLPVEPDPFRQSLCREMPTGTVAPAAQDAGEAGLVSVHEPGEAVLVRRGDLVVDTVGIPLRQSLDYAADQVRVVVRDFDSDASATVRPPEPHQRGLRITGAGDCDSAVFPQAVDMAGWLPLVRLVTHKSPFSEVDKALQGLSAAPDTPYTSRKVVLAPEGGRVPA
ncbi:alcohol dehydrogenase catalytic domain-containing protein [Streptomyces eurythermus]